ncbi:hypothetical protein WG75_11905 [Citromicrobium sp. WPS32]|nr:hypothetical protein WG75_11905 [Citromicrobium sp. WPS32]
MLLLDHCEKFGVEKTWQGLVDDSLPAVRIDAKTGEHSRIEPEIWSKLAKVVVHTVEDGREIARNVEMHPFDMLAGGNLSWLLRHDQDRILVPDFAAIRAAMEASQTFPPSPPSPSDVYMSPFMEMMLTAIKHFDITAEKYAHVKKATLEEYFKAQKLPDGTSVSPSMAGSMATFIRPVQAMKGGQKRAG